ncbi:MAG: Mur ligase family protein, partial [Bacteroidota bacterium]
IYRQSLDKLRVVIGGSHGKTTITSMILHVLRSQAMEFDYLVGAKLEGFDTMVSLSDAPIIIVEGDEYLSSPIDRRPKFHLYRAHIGVISGIAWDHINVFPTFAGYVDQFRIFSDGLPSDGKLIYCEADDAVTDVANKSSTSAKRIPYNVPAHKIIQGVTFLETAFGDVRLNIFGTHNLMNLEAARAVCNELGISNHDFYNSISSFKGAAKRLEQLGANAHVSVFKDFAHSPSKLKATVAAVRSQFPKQKLIACMELHTFSSLNDEFLKEYDGTMNDADIAMVYFNPHTIAHKQLPPVSVGQVVNAFNRKDLIVFTDSLEFKESLIKSDFSNCLVLLMSSGNFGGISLEDLAEEILDKV